MINLEDYAGSSEFPVVDAGDYEFVISAKITPFKNGGGDYLNVTFKIRDDIEQKFKGSCVFEKLFRDKTSPEWFDLTKSGSILVTQKGKEGYKAKFDEVEEFVQFINGITLKATVEKVFDDYSQKEVNQIKYLSYKPSALGPYVNPKQGKDAEKGSDEIKGNNLPNINPDDMPF